MMFARSLLIALLGALQAGCISSQMFGDKYYQESVTAYMASQDAKSAVVLGKQYTYVFELDERIRSALVAPYRGQLEMRIPQMVITTDGAATASYTIFLKNPPPEARDLALRSGYKVEGVSTLMTSGQVSGVRYQKFDLPAGAKLEGFSIPPRVVVVEKRQRSEKVAAAAVAPLSVAADGFLLLLGTPLYAARIMGAPGR